MTEDERLEQLDEWKKVVSLGRMGIVMPGDLSREDKHMERMKRRAEANQLAANLEAHKRKQHYEANPTYGAF